MIERPGDLWKEEGWKVVPTAGGVMAARDGFRLVLGNGAAAQALGLFPGIDLAWGDFVRRNGNVPCPLARLRLVSFPTKHHHSEPADLGLIRSSTLRLAAWACREDPEEVFLPRVGAVCGGLSWSHVRPLMEGILDDRFVVLY